MLPPIYWQAMLKGREWMAAPHKIANQHDPRADPVSTRALSGVWSAPRSVSSAGRLDPGGAAHGLSGAVPTPTCDRHQRLAVAANAATGLIGHAKAHTVKWRCRGMYAASGIVRALSGSTAGKAVDGGKFLFLFALVMVVVGV